MSHPFQDKLFAFIGKPERCTTTEARDALYAVGGVTDERISTFTEYVVEFKHNGKTEKYKKAVRGNENGYLVLLNEQQFFDIIEGKAEPPAKRKTKGESIVIPPKNTEAYCKEQDRVWKEIINEKRLNNLAKHGIPMPDGSRIKADLRALYTMRRIKEFMLQKFEEELNKAKPFERCDGCGAPAKVFLSDESGTVAKMCLDCHNHMMAEITGTDIPDSMPRRLAFRNNTGQVREFALEFYIFEGGSKLSAYEIGKTRLRAEVFGDSDDEFSYLLKKLSRRIERLLNEVFIEPDGSFINGRAVGYVDYNHERNDHDIVIDGKPFTWEQLKKNISAHEGWGITIEFGEVGADDDYEDE